MKHFIPTEYRPLRQTLPLKRGIIFYSGKTGTPAKPTNMIFFVVHPIIIKLLGREEKAPRTKNKKGVE